MPEACLSVLSTDACEWSLEGIWRSSDVVLRAIFLALALMLAYTVFFVLRFTRRYFLARREIHSLSPDDIPNFNRANTTLLADLSPGLGIFRGITTAAPFLGLAGTCYGFFAGFQDISGSRATALAYVLGVIVRAPVATIAGILVAIPAAFFHRLIRPRVEALRCRRLSSCNSRANDPGSFHFAQTLPLKKRFVGPPHYALVAASILACAVMTYMGTKLYPTSTGLPINLDRDQCAPGIVDRAIVFRVTSEGRLFLNYELEDRNALAQHLFDIYRLRHDRVLYLEAPDDVPFKNVADAIDLARKPTIGAESVDITVRLVTPLTEGGNSFVPCTAQGRFRGPL